MGVIANRSKAIQTLKSIAANRHETFAVDYSQRALNTIDEISPMVIAIVVRSLDNRINETFGIHLEADLLGYTAYDVVDLFPDLELSMLKKFNDFIRRHPNHIWIHWNMNSQDFGFQAIKHRYIKLSGERGNREFHEIPVNKKISFHNTLADIYGDNFIEGYDTFQELVKLNNDGLINNNYLSRSQESYEFDNRNYKSVTDSLHFKTDSLCHLMDKLISKKIKVLNKNFYALFIEFITHPIFNLIGWLTSIIGLIISIYMLF